ncbi:MAG: glycosyltransferase family 39 protein [Nitrospirae bacterium]|nr:glycosyltransferase family 39 protein [Nitrospirota bacterium]
MQRGECRQTGNLFREVSDKKLILIVLFALFLRTAALILAQPWGEPVLLIDDQKFNEMALSFAEKFDFSYGVEHWTSDKYTPGYPLFIALIYIIFGAKIWLVPVFQVLLDVGTVVIIYLISKEIFQDKAIPLISALLYSMSVLSIILTQQFCNETLFTFIFSLSILLLIHAVKANRLWRFALVGFVMGTATLVRPILLYFSFLVAFVLLLQKIKPLRKVYIIAALLLTFFAVLSPWQMRNLQTYGHYSLTFIDGFTLSNFNATIVKANLENKSTEAVKKDFLATVEGIKNPFEKSKVLKKSALEYISGHPLEYLRFHIKGVAMMFLGTAEEEVTRLFGIEKDSTETRRRPLSESFVDRFLRKLNDGYYLVSVTENLAAYSFFLTGLFMIYFKDRETDPKIYSMFLLLIIFYFANITGIVGSSRYKVPIIPFYLMISARGIHGTLGKIRSWSNKKNMAVALNGN